MKKVSFILFVLFCSTLVSAQKRELDSLNSLLKDPKVNDTAKVDALFNLTELLYLRNFDTILPLSNRALAIIDKALKTEKNKAIRVEFLQRQATAYNNIGVYFVNMGKVDSALKFYGRTLEIQKSLNDQGEIATTYYNLGSIYKKQGKIETALGYFRKALTLARKNKNYNQIAMNCMSLAMTYADQKDFEKALEYYKESESGYKKTGNQYGLSMIYHNLGGYYEGQRDTALAIDYYEKALKIKEEIGDLIGLGYTLNNLGNIYSKLNQKEKSLEYFKESYNLFLSQNYTDGLANASGNLSEVYFERGDFVQALKYGEEAYKIAQQTGFPENLRNASLALYKIYEKQKKFEKAMEFYRLYCEMRDSLENDKTRKASLASRMQFDFDKKNLKDSLEHEKENELNKSRNEKLDAELKAKTNLQVLLFGGLALVIVFAIFMYNRFRITQKQNKVIEEQKKEVELQKHIVEEKQKEIIDSINYAQRLQKAILAPKSEIDKYIPENFLFYQPKDIVAGDFYFFEVTPTHIFYAAADCTGHGVPGAMVSIVCSNALTRCVKEFNLSDPGKILDKTRELILETFQKSGEDVKDGMDISLLAIGRKNKSMRWAGAHNPLLYTINGEMKEMMADKQPIGKTDHFKPFTTQFLQEGITSVFLFTDGFADQFGGAKGKKFKNANLKKLLLESENISGSQLEEKINDTFLKWKGDLEQVDDVCIIRIRL